MSLLFARWLSGGAMNLTMAAASLSLQAVSAVFAMASDSAVVETVLHLVLRSLEALTQSLSGAAMILRGVLTNQINSASLDFILDHLADLFQFLYDLFRPANVIPRYPAAMGGANNPRNNDSDDNAPGAGAIAVADVQNPYNELDLWLEANRKAVVYQIQRVIITLISILRLGEPAAAAGSLNDVRINASLRSDFDAAGRPPPATYTSSLPPGRRGGVPQPDEKWLFINGIANEFVWFQRSCDKIRDTFRRDVRGVYNRSDGVLWDLVECCGERAAATLVPNPLVQSTQSSRAAQEELYKELAHALRGAAGSPAGKVVMIAHSQGVLILRLVLQRLVAEDAKGGGAGAGEMRRLMRERLWVFTFGSPSVDWRVADGGVVRPLGNFARVTEHFAHRADFVAMLGVVNHQDEGYDDDSAVFFSHNGRGHLFGAHYPLGAESYEDGDESRLLAAVGGVPL